MENHIKIKHGYVTICGECGENFQSTKACEEHISEKHKDNSDNEEIKCSLCSKPFTTRKDFDLHTAEHHVDRNFPCNICNHVAASFTDMVKHKSDKHDEGTSISRMEEMFMNVMIAQQAGGYRKTRRCIYFCKE